MRLAQSFSHFYARWDDPVNGEQFNIETSHSAGVDFHDEDYYRQKVIDMGAGALIEEGNYFQSMSPREELSSFLTTRADCLREHGRWAAAFDTYRQAVELAPDNLFAAGLLRMTGQALQQIYAAEQAELAYHRHEQRRRTDPRLRIPGLPSVPTAHSVNLRQSGQGYSRPVPRQLPTSASTGLPPNFHAIFPNATGWQPSPMHDYLNKINRQNQEWARYAKPPIEHSGQSANAVPPWARVSGYPAGPSGSTTNPPARKKTQAQPLNPNHSADRTEQDIKD